MIIKTSKENDINLNEEEQLENIIEDILKNYLYEEKLKRERLDICE
ncbi:hypothetical protein [Haloimpatiens massiliensis]|nr:hypothetical protein [Haloimpatiens massiliensis]